MKWFICSAAIVAALAGTPTQAANIDYRPIDTRKLVVQPSKAAANLAAGTINLVGQTTASAVESNGYIKTLNNLFGVKRRDPATQTQVGPSSLPSPNLYRSTQYRNYNTPVMPVYPRR